MAVASHAGHFSWHPHGPKSHWQYIGCTGLASTLKKNIKNSSEINIRRKIEYYNFLNSKGTAYVLGKWRVKSSRKV